MRELFIDFMQEAVQQILLEYEDDIKEIACFKVNFSPTDGEDVEIDGIEYDLVYSRYFNEQTGELLYNGFEGMNLEYLIDDVLPQLPKGSITITAEFEGSVIQCKQISHQANTQLYREENE
jgi:hypothetical protein